jgi:hypothetical protein
VEMAIRAINKYSHSHQILLASIRKRQAAQESEPLEFRQYQFDEQKALQTTVAAAHMTGNLPTGKIPPANLGECPRARRRSSPQQQIVPAIMIVQNG